MVYTSHVNPIGSDGKNPDLTNHRGSSPIRGRRYTSSRVERKGDPESCSWGEASERSHVVAECDLCERNGDVLEGEVREVNEGGMT